MDEDEKELFGFLIDNEIQFDIANKRLIRISTIESEHSMVFGAVSLSDTMVRLLVCLLTHSFKGESSVLKTTIFKEVWEDHMLVSSSQQLWKTIRALKLKICSIGLSEDFISSFNGVGYSLKNHNVKPLFIEKSKYENFVF